ncbi:MAG: tRNA-intron lyase [Candidatus Methanofastidiosia archaeon]
MMQGKLENNKIVVSDNSAISKLHGKRAYGIMSNGKLYLSLLEAYYLFEKGKLQVLKNNKSISSTSIKSLVDKETDFNAKYCVYKDLRDRGYIVKTGFKYGCHFRVYRNSIEEHAEYLVQSFIEHDSIITDDIIRHVRLAHSVKKKMIFALVDEENDISYISFNRIKI